MNRSFVATMFFLAFGLVMAGCIGGTSESASEADDDATQETEASEGGLSEALSAAREALTGGRKVEAVEKDKLKALLPDALAGLDRVSYEATREGAFGFNVTTAKGEYGEGDRTIELAIMDIGGVSNAAMLGFAWMKAEVDRETQDTYERTGTYDGYRSHEKYDRRSQDGELQVIVADRFIVALDGNGVEMDDLKDALKHIDLDALEDMRDEGVTDAD